MRYETPNRKPFTETGYLFQQVELPAVRFGSMIMTFQKTARSFFIFVGCVSGLYIVMFLITAAFIGFSLGVSLDDYIPFMSDQLLYWKQVQNLRQFFGTTGYFGHEEALSLLNRIGFDSPGASHGLAINILYSALSLPAWEYATPLRLNFFLSALGLALYLFISGNSWKTNAVIIFTAMCLYPIHYFNSYNSFQSVHILLICLAAGLIVRMLRTAALEDRKMQFILLLVVIAVGALFRKNWALFFLPTILLLPTSKKRWLVYVGVALIVTVALGAIFDATRSPYPYQEFTEDQRPYVFSALAQGNIIPLIQQVSINIGGFAHFIGNGDFATCYSLFLIAIIVFFTLLLRTTPQLPRLKLFNIITMLISLSGSVVAYYIFQIMLLKIVFQAFFLLLLVNGPFLPKRALLFFLALNLIFLPKCLENYGSLAVEYRYASEKQDAIEKFRQQTKNYFPMNQTDRWKNTVLTFGYPQELLGLPPYISFMDTRDPFLQERGYKVHTGYVLVDDIRFEELLTSHNAMRLLARTSAGNLYAVD